MPVKPATGDKRKALSPPPSSSSPSSSSVPSANATQGSDGRDIDPDQSDPDEPLDPKELEAEFQAHGVWNGWPIKLGNDTDGYYHYAYRLSRVTEDKTNEEPRAIIVRAEGRQVDFPGTESTEIELQKATEMDLQAELKKQGPWTPGELVTVTFKGVKKSTGPYHVLRVERGDHTRAFPST